MSQGQPKKKRRLGRKLALSGLVLLLLLGVVIALAGPAIASSVGRGIAERAISSQIAGHAEIQTLKLSWAGPQRIERVTLYDPAGVEVAQINGEVQGGLLSLARNPRSLKKLTLTGSANIVEHAPGQTNLAAAVERTSDPVHVDATKSPSTHRPSGEPASVLQGLDIEVDLASFDVTYAARGQTVKLDDLSMQALIKPGAPLTLEVSCANAGVLANGSPGRLAGTVTINDLIATNGTLSPAGASGKGSISAALPGQWAAMVMSTLGLQTQLPKGDASLDFHLHVADGRVRITPDAPTAIAMPAPADLVLGAAGASQIESLVADGPVAVRVSKLDVPLAGVLGDPTADWRNAQFEVALDLPAMQARALGLPGTAPDEAAQIALPASSIVINTPNLSQGIMVNGSLTATVNGESIGDVRLGGVMRNIITAEGHLARDMSQARMEGALRIDNLPASLAQRYAQLPQIDLAQIAGGPIDLAIEAKADADLGAGGTIVMLDVQSPLTSARLDAIWRGDRVEMQRNGLHIESRAGDALRSLARLDDSLHATGPDLIVINMPQASFPWTKPRGIVWSELRAQATIELQGLMVQAAGEGPLAIARMSTMLTKNADEPVIAVRVEGADDRSSFSAAAAITAIGGTQLLRALETKQPLDISKLMYEGNVAFDGAPVRLVSFVDPKQAAQLSSALGPTISGELTIEPVRAADGATDATHVYGMAQAQQVAFFGGVIASGSLIEASTSQPISITLRQPLATAGALGVDTTALLGPRVSLVELDSATLDVRSLRVPLQSPKDALRHGLDASALLTGVRLLATDSTGAATPCAFDTITTKLRSTAEISAPLQIELRAKNIPAAHGSIDLDASVTNWAALLGSTDSVQPDAAIDATAKGDLPVALLDALAGANGLLVAMIGDRAVTDVSLQRVAADRSAGTFTATMKAPRADARVFGRFEDGSLVLSDQGESSTQAALTRIEPALSQRLLEPIFPLFTSFERADSERPTMITTSQLSVPTNGDFTKLNGSISVDLGSMRFAAAPLLAAVLDATSNNTEGALLANVKPIDVLFQQGVATYSDLTIPWGSFDLQSRGTIDLVRKKMDVVAFVPLAGLGGDFRRTVQGTPGLDKLAMIPLRAKGDLGKARLQLDPDLISEALPGLIESTLGDLLKGATERDSKDTDEPTTDADKDQKDKQDPKKKKEKKDKKKDGVPDESSPPADAPQDAPPPEPAPQDPPSRWGSPRPR